MYKAIWTIRNEKQIIQVASTNSITKLCELRHH